MELGWAAPDANYMANERQEGICPPIGMMMRIGTSSFSPDARSKIEIKGRSSNIATKGYRQSNN